ncbi:MAG TPA: hypothetical protein VLL75_13450 [Vicinamibacteria bacterium]|nr:hypothetical protein [Vicinamibacteria bacterium]
MTQIIRVLVARLLPAATLAWLAGAAPAGARVGLDYTSVGEFSEPFSYNNCGVSVRGSGDLNVNAASGGPGIAVADHDAGSFDGGETLTFEFWDDVADERVAATEVSYVASVAPGPSDGDAVPAELSIEAFGPGNVSLGTQAFSGTSEQSVSAAFGGAPIESFVMTASPDSVRIERVAYAPAPGTAISVRWTNGGAYEREQIELCGLTLTGSDTLSVGGLGAGGGGVGVVGGSVSSDPDHVIDSGETLEVAFPEPTRQVAYHMSRLDFLTIVGFVEFDLDAFGAQDAPLGSAQIQTGVGDVGVSDLFPGDPISRFVIEASPPGTGDGQQVGFVSFLVPEPGSGASGLAALACVAALARSARCRRWCRAEDRGASAQAPGRR